jgi:uncharacterized protein (TIGR00251 family)
MSAVKVRPAPASAPPVAACRLKIKAAPNAAENAVAGRVGDAWKIRLHAVPEDGKANKALLEFLAEKLSLPRVAIELVSGGSSREKLVAVQGLTLAKAEEKMLAP